MIEDLKKVIMYACCSMSNKKFCSVCPYENSNCEDISVTEDELYEILKKMKNDSNNTIV